MTQPENVAQSLANIDSYILSVKQSLQRYGWATPFYIRALRRDDLDQVCLLYRAGFGTDGNDLPKQSGNTWWGEFTRSNVDIYSIAQTRALLSLNNNNPLSLCYSDQDIINGVFNLPGATKSLSFGAFILTPDQNDKLVAFTSVHRMELDAIAKYLTSRANDNNVQSEILEKIKDIGNESDRFWTWTELCKLVQIDFGSLNQPIVMSLVSTAIRSIGSNDIITAYTKENSALHKSIKRAGMTDVASFQDDKENQYVALAFQASTSKRVIRGVGLKISWHKLLSSIERYNLNRRKE